MAGRPGAMLRALLILLLLWSAQTSAALAAVVRLDAAELIDLTEPGRPLPRMVSLPDAWESTAPQRDGRVIYRFALPDEVLAGTQPALFLRRAGNVFRVRLNSVPVATVGREQRPLPHHGNEPYLIRLPLASLQSSGNRLEIEVIGEPHREAGLSRVWVGSEEELAPRYDEAMNIQVRGAWVVSAVSGTMGALALLIAWRARQPGYGWFAVANVISAWRMTALTVHQVGPWTGLLPWFFNLSYSLFVASLMMFCAGVVRGSNAAVRRPLAVFVALSCVTATGNWWLNLPLLRTLHLLLILVVVVVATVVLARIAVREHSRPAILLFLCAAFAMVVGARDWYVFRVLYDHDAYTWSRYVSLLLMCALTWLLVDDYTRTLQRLQQLTHAQQATIEAKERELQQAFELRRDHERRQAALDERDRILREMHDGLGGRLVGAIALARQLHPGPSAPSPGLVGELRHTLDDCLIELRLALDSLEVDQRSLGEALAEMRFRVEPSLRAAGLRLGWDVEDGAMEVELPAAETLHVLRIVREAFTNVIKHAGATVVRLSLRREGQAVVLRVQDNGASQRPAAAAGAEPGLSGGRRGLANMRQRAQLMGAQLELGPHEDGWAVTLRLSSPAPAQAAA